MDVCVFFWGFSKKSFQFLGGLNHCSWRSWILVLVGFVRGHFVQNPCHD